MALWTEISKEGSQIRNNIGFLAGMIEEILGGYLV